MLQIGIHNRDVGSRGDKHSFNARGGQATAADSLEDAHARIGAPNLADGCGRPVGRVVIDKHSLPLNSGQRRAEPFEKRHYIGAFIEGRDHHRKFEGSGRLRTGNSHGDDQSAALASTAAGSTLSDTL